MAITRVLAVGLLVGVMCAGRAEAAIINVVPGQQSANVGDIVVVDIVVSGLAAGESVGGVSLFLSFTDAILQGLAVVVDPDDKMGVELNLSGVFGASPLDLFFVAEDFGVLGPADDHAALKALQGGGFSLARISFTAVGDGVSPLALSGVVLSNGTGTGTIPLQAIDGRVCVGQATAGRCVVPEPGLLALLATGLATAVVRRRQAKR